jgi:hypothetical protein
LGRHKGLGKPTYQQTKQRDSLLSIKISPTAINTEACKVFDESPTPKLVGFSYFYNQEYFSPAAKCVQSPQERFQTIDRVMARTTQVPESLRSLSSPMDLNLLQDMVCPPWMLETLDKLASLLDASNNSTNPL